MNDMSLTSDEEDYSNDSCMLHAIVTSEDSNTNYIASHSRKIYKYHGNAKYYEVWLTQREHVSSMCMIPLQFQSTLFSPTIFGSSIMVVVSNKIGLVLVGDNAETIINVPLEESFQKEIEKDNSCHDICIDTNARLVVIVNQSVIQATIQFDGGRAKCQVLIDQKNDFTPSALALDSSNNIYILDYAHSHFYRYDALSKKIHQVRYNSLTTFGLRPRFIAVDKTTGIVYTDITDSKTISTFTIDTEMNLIPYTFPDRNDNVFIGSTDYIGGITIQYSKCSLRYQAVSTLVQISLAHWPPGLSTCITEYVGGTRATSLVVSTNHSGDEVCDSYPIPIH